jgi:hypothetical protein
MSDQLHVVLHPVQAERADDFERFVSEVVATAVRSQRPDLDERWRFMRSSDTANRGVTFAFLLEDGSLTEDGELDLILPAHQGKEEADRLLAEWAGSFAPLALGRRQPFRRAKRAIRSYGLWSQSPTPEQGIVRSGGGH